MNDNNPLKRIIIVICMVDSVHSARWLSQFKNENIEFVLIPSTPNRNIHPTIKLLISDSETRAVFKLSKLYKFFPILLWSIDQLLGNRFRGRLVARLAKRTNADFIHAMELNHGGYIALRSFEAGLPEKCKIISSNWGSDIYWFQNFTKHKSLIEKLMAASSIYSAECNRDLDLATKYGFTGKFREVLPNSGGFSNSVLSTKLNLPSVRKVILVKGYESFVGRASIALEAISELQSQLAGYEVVVYSSNKSTSKRVEIIRKKFGIDIRAIPKKKLSHHEMLDLFAQARIYIGVSLSDGISTSLLEAMAMGAFPIQTNTSCAQEWIVDGVSGKSVNPDPSAVKLALLEALSNDALVDNAMTDNHLVIKTKLNNEIVSSKMSQFYKI